MFQSKLNFSVPITTTAKLKQLFQPFSNMTKYLKLGGGGEMRLRTEGAEEPGELDRCVTWKHSGTLILKNIEKWYEAQVENDPTDLCIKLHCIKQKNKNILKSA